MYTRDFDDLATLINLADAFLPAPVLLKKPASIAYRLGSDAPTKPTEGTPGSTAPVKRRRTVPPPTFAWEPTEGGMVLRAATPGLKKEDLSIKMVDEGAQRHLVVSGGTKDPATEEHAEGAGDGTGKGNDADKDKTAAPNQDTVSHAPKPSTPSDEYYYAAFEHRVRLPANVTGDCLAARYEDGMLTLILTLPAEKPPQFETIPIA